MVASKIDFSYYIGFYILVFDTYMPGFLFILKAYRISVHTLYALSYSAYYLNQGLHYTLSWHHMKSTRYAIAPNMFTILVNC